MAKEEEIKDDKYHGKILSFNSINPTITVSYDMIQSYII